MDIPILFIMIVALFSHSESSSAYPYSSSSLNRNNFSSDFIFGAASSSYQYEGAVNEDGRGSSIWDTFVHKNPSRVVDGKNGDVAVDSYHRYKEDVKILKEIGLDAYRFSISWSRILPSGKRNGGINKEGIQYYNNLVNELLDKGLVPFITLFHWDLPQALEDEYDGFLSPNIVEDFKDYADICFREFGDRVKYWITLNEPWSYSFGGYVVGLLAPGRCSSSIHQNCTGGDSATEPYLVTHHQLLAHAAAVKLYRDKYQANQKGKIGITLVTQWTVPYSEARHDQNAALRYLDFMVGWFMEPLTSGIYPRTMRYLVGQRLPKFSKEQSKMLKGSFDFLGLNYYTANYARNVANHKHSTVHSSYETDSLVNLQTKRNGKNIGPQAGSGWLFVYPRGIRDILLYVKKKYNNPLIYITENGVDEVNNGTLSLEEALVDNMRIDYFYRHLSFLKQAIEDGVNVKGYFAWSLLDNFEWISGYTVRFGIYFVDYKDGLKRHPKRSAKWFRNFLRRKKTL